MNSNHRKKSIVLNAREYLLIKQIINISRKARDMKFMRKIQQKQWMRLGMQGNNQKHFRDPTGFIQ